MISKTMKYTHIKLILLNSSSNYLETYVFPVREVRHVLMFFSDIISAIMECTITLYSKHSSDEVSFEYIPTIWNDSNSDYRGFYKYQDIFRKFLKSNLIPLYPREYHVNLKDRLVHSEKL